MKYFILLFWTIITIENIQSQDYQIDFTGTGASILVDSIKIENVTQCNVLSINGNDILHLTSTSEIYELNNVPNNSFLLYPNPMNGSCTINFAATRQGSTTIELFNIIGKNIIQIQEVLSIGQHSYNISGISNGIYSLKIESGKLSYKSKIICINSNNDKPEIKHTLSKSNFIVLNNEKNYLESKSLIEMQYNAGDILKFTGFSGGLYKSIFMLVPTQSQTITFNFVSCVDAENNNYSVVQIGNQIWMAENLNTTKYRNGDSIPNITDGSEWYWLTTHAYCNYSNNPLNSSIYGRLYNLYAIKDTRNICPLGWHIPSKSELDTLYAFLGGYFGGGKLKDKCSMLWLSPNTGATNEYGFSAIPSGMRTCGGAFEYIDGLGSWWSITEIDPNNNYYFGVWNYNSIFFTSNHSNTYGHSVRCIKD